MTIMDPLELQQGFFDLLLQSQYWPEDRMREHQRTLLDPLIRHARQNVPFYETRLNVLFRSDGSIDWDRWHEIPIVKRSDLLEHRQDMLARTVPPSHGIVKDFTTSGSTGPPVTVTHNSIAAVFSGATVYRGHLWHELDWSRTSCRWFGDDPKVAAWPDGRVLGSWGPGWHPKARQGRALEINRQATPAQVLSFVKRHRPSYLSARPKSVQALALEALRQGVAIDLKGVTTFGAGITSDEREDVSAAFGCQMVALYSSKEGHAMGYQCPTGQHYHVHSETVLVELVDANGIPVGDGQVGHVVVTPLVGTAQPLLRYDQGDLAVRGPPCSCGRTLPVIERLVGRTTHLFVLPDGRRIAPSVPPDLRRSLGARYWQFAQVAPLTIEVRYVPENAGESGDRQAIIDSLRDQTSEDMQVEFCEVESMTATNGDKYIEYVSELPRTNYRISSHPNSGSQ